MASQGSPERWWKRNSGGEAGPQDGWRSHTKPGFMEERRQLGQLLVPLFCRHLERQRALFTQSLSFQPGPSLSLLPSPLQGRAWAWHQEVEMEACTCHSPEASLALVSESLNLQKASLNSLWGE